MSALKHLTLHSTDPSSPLLLTLCHPHYFLLLLPSATVAALPAPAPCLQESDCSICFEEMLDLNSRRLNPCGHRYHNHCINVSVSNNDMTAKCFG